MEQKAACVCLLLAVSVLVAPAAAGGGFYFDRADFANQVGGLFYDVYVDYFPGTYPIGAFINSMVFPTGGVFDSNTVPLIDSGITTAGGTFMQFVNGNIAAEDANVYVGVTFLGGGDVRAGGMYVETLQPTEGDTDYLYGQAHIENGQIRTTFRQDKDDSQFVGYYQNFLMGSLNGIYAYVVGYDIDLSLTRPSYASVSHLVLESRYLSSGGDPHIKSSVIDAVLPGLAASDHVNLFRHPEMTANARLRSFEFLDFEHATYYGAVGVSVANGDRIEVEAYEEDDGSVAFRVTMNGEALEVGSAVSVEAGTASYEVHYDRHGAVPHGRSVSVFHKDYPYMHHEAVVRVLMAGVAAIDIDLAWKDAFVDWHRATPEVYRQAGAFLNVAVRDLVQESRSEAGGLLKATDRMQRVKLAIEAKATEALDAVDSEAHRRSIEASEQMEKMLDEIVAQHQVDSLF